VRLVEELVDRVLVADVDLHVRDLPIYDYREALRPSTRISPAEHEGQAMGTALQPGAEAPVKEVTLTRTEFVEFLAAGFGLSGDAARSKTRCLSELTEVLAHRHGAGVMSALVIDEAQCLPDDLLEEIRLLANIESATEKLLSIVLAGQPEIAYRLNQPALRQLKQRIGLRCSLTALSLPETSSYIAERMRIAGGSDGVFTDDAIAMIHERARGIPRTISVIADNALVTGFALDYRPVDREVVLEVCRDFDFGDRADDVRPVPSYVPPVDSSAAHRNY